MKYSLAERHLLLANNTRSARLSIVSAEEVIASDIENGKYLAGEFMDFTQAVSGDDLARLRADDYRIVKHIGEQRGLWSDVRRGSQAAAA